MTVQEINGQKVYQGDTFQIVMTRYSDPERLNLARNAARYLGKKDIDNIRRPLSIVRQGHVPEIFRGEQGEFEFIDVSKEVYDHLVTYTTRNMRVAGGNRALTSDDFTMPSDKMKDPDMVKTWIENSMEGYKCLLDHAETPQVARSAMPVAAKLNIFVYQWNFLTLGQSVFKQRLWEKGAQGNTVKVVQGMWELVHSVDPELWDTFYEYMGEPAVEWVEVRRKLKKSQVKLGDFINLANEYAVDTHEQVTLEEFLKLIYGQQKSMW